MDDRAPRHAQAVEPVPVQNPDLARLKDISYFDKAEVLTRVIIMGVLSVALAYWKDDQTYLWLYAADFLMSSAAIMLVRRAPDTMTQRAFSLYSLLGNMPMLALLVASVYLWMDPDVFLQMMAVALLFSLLISMLMIRSVDAVVFNWDAGGMAITMAILVLIDVERFGLAGRPVVSALMFAGAFAYFLHCASVIVRVRRSLDDAQVMEVQRSKIEAIGRLTGGVAHDFNNLLTAITGHCDLLLLRHDPGDPDHDDLEQIGQNANRAAALVGQLLAFSRKQTFQTRQIDLRDTMADLTHLLNRLVGEKITLELNAESGLKHVRADPRQLEQVMMNLVVNARDAMPDGGTITIEARPAVLHHELIRDRATIPPGDYVVLQVSDAGIGIAPENLHKVFEPFYTTKRTGEGTGLGLSTVYGIVKQTGGFIFANSAVGSGTTFTLYFPAEEAQSETLLAAPPIEEAPAVAEPLAEGDVVILLVEDEAPVRAFASRALRMRGYTVLEAENAEDALAQLDDDSLHVDVFVTDVIMPGMDGPSWVSAALKRRPDTRVIFVSGYAQENFAESQAQIPHSIFLPKPFSLTELTDTVQRQLH